MLISKIAMRISRNVIQSAKITFLRVFQNVLHFAARFRPINRRHNPDFLWCVVRGFTGLHFGTKYFTLADGTLAINLSSIKVSSEKWEVFFKNIEFQHSCRPDINRIDHGYYSPVCFEDVGIKISSIGQVHVTWHYFSRRPIENWKF